MLLVRSTVLDIAPRMLQTRQSGGSYLYHIKRLLDDEARRTIEDIIPYENVIHDSLSLLIGADRERAKTHDSLPG